MSDERFSIGELATAAATTPRTIRFYTTEGLLPPPLTEGRNAIYTDVHRRRLRLIQRLKAAYLPLSAIKEQMAGLTDEQVTDLLERSGPRRVENTSPPHAPRSSAHIEEPQSSNVAYVAQILAVAEQALTASPGSEDGSNAKRVLIVSPALRSVDDSETVNTASASDGFAYGEQWARIVLRPGIEIHIRQPVPESFRAGLEQWIALSQALFPESR